MKRRYFFLFPLFVATWACASPARPDSIPDGSLSLSGAAVREGNVVSGVDSRAGEGVVLALSSAAADYLASRGSGYEWKIHRLGDVDELSSLDAGAERFQLIADESPPMSRRVIAGKLLPDGVYQVELELYSNQVKVGDVDYLLTSYKLMFSLRNK